MIKPKEIQIRCVGYSIAADWYRGDNNKALLVLPGFKSSKARQEGLTSALVKQTSSSALVIDYSGHGESPFKLNELTPAQNFLEVITAFDWLVENYPDMMISVAGSSYGGFLATQLTKYRVFEKLVLRAPAIYPSNFFYDNFGGIDSNANRDYRADAQNYKDHPLLRRASKFKGNVLVVTHELDEICPKPSTDAFIRAFSADSWQAEGLEHSIRASSHEEIKEYQTKIADWLNSN